MSETHATCPGSASGHPPYTPPADSADCGSLLDFVGLKALVPQVSGLLGIGIAGSGDTSDANAVLAAHVGGSEGTGASVSLLGGVNPAGDMLDQPGLLDAIVGDCGLI